MNERDWVMRGKVLLEAVAAAPLAEYWINTTSESNSLADVLEYPEIARARRESKALDIACTVYLENQEISVLSARESADSAFCEKNRQYYFG